MMYIEKFLLKEYLNDNLTGYSSNDLIEHFAGVGVNVSVEDDLYLFKYDQISARWDLEVTHNCRGTILRRTGDTWEYVSIPFNKFFNLGEGKCSFFDSKVFKEHSPKISYVEKIDGSCVQVWYDEVKGIWRASTLGSISTASVFDHPFTFSDLFWKVFGSARPFEIGYTYIFELWTCYNQVVTVYPEDRITILGVRNNKTMSLDEVDLVKTATALGVKIPYRYEGLNFNDSSELEGWVEAQSLREDIFGKVPEGFVGFYGNIPVFKSKNLKYCQYHKLVTGDKTFILKNIVSTVFHGNIDDIYGDLNEDLRDFVDRLKIELIRLQLVYLRSFKHFAGIDPLDKKAYALKVQEITKENSELGMFQAFYYEHRDDILSGETPSVLDWVTAGDRFMKYIEKWKVI